ncbi:MAG: hypothetical protein KatS3mg023_4035 [Armatimonadota bacterium]|nr:MAG: hypothetical protein KatS3mg023_4035 [Armatimonadota bacterium]
MYAGTLIVFSDTVEISSNIWFQIKNLRRRQILADSRRRINP